MAQWDAATARRRLALLPGLVERLEAGGSGAETLALRLFTRCTAAIRLANMKLFSDQRVSKHAVLGNVTLLSHLLKLGDTASSSTSGQGGKGASGSTARKNASTKNQTKYFSRELAQENINVHGFFRLSDKICSRSLLVLERACGFTGFNLLLKTSSDITSYFHELVKISSPVLLTRGLELALLGSQDESLMSSLAKGCLFMLQHPKAGCRTAVAQSLVHHQIRLPHSVLKDVVESYLLSSLKALGDMASWYNEEHASAMWRLLELVVPIHISQLQATSSKPAEAEAGIAAQASIHDFMVHVRESLVELAQREDVARPANESFAMRDYRRDTCGSSRTTALRLLLFIGKRFAQVCSGAVFDKKSLVRTTLLGLVSPEYEVAVDALQLLRMFLPKTTGLGQDKGATKKQGADSFHSQFAVCVSVARLTLGEELYHKVAHLDHFLRRAEDMKATKSRVRKNWKSALRSATSSVKSIGGAKIVSEEASIRSFITSELKSYRDGLQIACRRLGEVEEDHYIDTASEKDTTASVRAAGRLAGKIVGSMHRVRRKRAPNSYTPASAHPSLGVGRYHDEGVIHFPGDSAPKTRTPRPALLPTPHTASTRVMYRPFVLGTMDKKANADEAAESSMYSKSSFLLRCNNRSRLTDQRLMSSGISSVVSMERAEAESAAADLLEQVQKAKEYKLGAQAKIAARMGTAASKQASRGDEGMTDVEKGMEILSNRTQRHARKPRLTVDHMRAFSDDRGRRRRGWATVAPQESQSSQLARAMLRGWCCGYDVNEMQRRFAFDAQSRQHSYGK